MENAAVRDSTTRNTSPRRVLVVDDDESVRELCKEVLGVAGYEVETAAHGHEGLDMLKKSGYDLVISDVNMPGLGGVEFFESAAGRYPGLKERFLLMTGDCSFNQKEKASALKVNCLYKPFRISELIGTVDDMMASSLQGLYGTGWSGKRQEGRLTFTAGCDARENGTGRTVKAVTVNISRNGLLMSYEGEPLAGDSAVTLKFSINRLTIERSASVRWSMKVAGGSSSGALFSERLPVSSIINIPANAVS